MEGTITISRYSNYREDDDKSIAINIEDKTSGTVFLRISMTPRDLMMALTGQGYIDCDFELFAANVGKKRELKTEKIFVDGYSFQESDKDKILAPYEVDGWMAHRNDLGNHHLYHTGKNGDNYYEVGFTRFVE